MASAEFLQFQQRMARIEQLLQGFEQLADPAARANARELAHVLLELHGEGLARLMGIIDDQGETGRALLDQLARDEVVSGLLLLHDLHPLDLETRVRQALEGVRPHLLAHGGNVELLAVETAGVVRLALKGSCQGCASSRLTLTSRVEQAVYAAAPEVTAIEVEGMEAGVRTPPGECLPPSTLDEHAAAAADGRSMEKS